MKSNDLLYVQMRDYLLDLIARNKAVPNYKLPSENQLALRFGASRISAKHAFDTLEEEKLIYRQRGRGTFVADGANNLETPGPKTLGDTEDAFALIIPFTSTIFMSEIIEGIQEELDQRGQHFIIFLTDNDQRKEVKYLRIAQEQFKGALLFPGAYNKYHEELLRLVLSRYPLVQIDRNLPGLNLSYVACDHRGATYRAVEFLLKRGHERIGFIGHLLGHASSVAERFRGFDQATQEHDPAYPNFFKLNVADALENFDQLFTEYMTRAKPTAIISSSHLHGPSIMRILKQMGVAHNVDLMLYDNEFAITSAFMEYHPFIIDQQPRIIGRTAAKLAYDLAYEGAKPANVLLPEKITQV